MADLPPDVLAKMQALQDGFGVRLRARLADMQQQCSLCRVTPAERIQFELLYRQLHSLSGSAGTFGFTALGVEARRIEDQLRVWLDDGSWAQQDLAPVAAALDALAASLPGAPPAA
jgi:HPt (histidine-containing phosphotransfer) domain-containing protein